MIERDRLEFLCHFQSEIPSKLFLFLPAVFEISSPFSCSSASILPSSPLISSCPCFLDLFPHLFVTFFYAHSYFQNNAQTLALKFVFRYFFFRVFGHAEFKRRAKRGRELPCLLPIIFGVPACCLCFSEIFLTHLLYAGVS